MASSSKVSDMPAVVSVITPTYFKHTREADVLALLNSDTARRRREGRAHIAVLHLKQIYLQQPGRP